MLAFSAGSAMAVPLTLQADGIPGYLAQGSYQGSFDGASLLPSTFSINSLQFSFVFIDDGDTVVYTTSPSVTSEPATVRQAIDSKTFKETVTKTLTMPRLGLGEQESVRLSFGALSLFGETVAIDSSSLVPTGSSSSTQVLYQISGTKTSCTAAQWTAGTDKCEKITRTTTTTYQTSMASTDYTGQIAFDGSLMDADALLSTLMLKKRLGFSLDVLGDLDLAYATLDIDYDVPSIGGTDQIEPVIQVPEPASLGLLGIALLGMAGVRRKQRA